MATHVKVIAVLFLVCGVFLVAAALFFPAVLGLIASLVRADADPDAEVATAILGITGVALSAILGLLSIPFLATGWGMLKLKPWSRIAGIVLGALCLPQIPFGTVIGIYALVILFRKDTEALFTARA